MVLAITGLVTAVGVAVGFGSASSGSREVAPRPVASGKKGKATPIITTQPTNPEAINPSDGLPGDLQYLTSDSPTELADQYATNLQGYYNTGNASYLEFSYVNTGRDNALIAEANETRQAGEPYIASHPGFHYVVTASLTPNVAQAQFSPTDTERTETIDLTTKEVDAVGNTLLTNVVTRQLILEPVTRDVVSGQTTAPERLWLVYNAVPVTQP